MNLRHMMISKLETGSRGVGRVEGRGSRALLADSKAPFLQTRRMTKNAGALMSFCARDALFVPDVVSWFYP